MDITFNSEFIANSAMFENVKNVAENAKNAKTSHALKKATKDFEAMFINMVIKAMWKTIPKSGLYEKSSSTNIYEGIIHSTLSKEIANGGGFGMAKILYERVSSQHDLDTKAFGNAEKKLKDTEI